MAEEPLTVLVVEDNQGDIRLIEDGFEESHVEHTLTIVNDGEAALEHLCEWPPSESASRPDLVLLDLNVPKTNGIDVLERIDTATGVHPVPIVVLSGSAAEDHVVDTFRMGAHGYFVKPVDPHEFLSLIERIASSMVGDESLPRGEHSRIEPTD